MVHATNKTYVDPASLPQLRPAGLATMFNESAAQSIES